MIVSSDNSANNGYVKVGDEITITLVTDGTNLGNATGTILGDNILAQNSPTGTITFSKTITQNDTNGNPTFDIFVTNSSGYAASITQNNLTSSNIIIDTVPPLLYLYGVNNTVFICWRYCIYDNVRASQIILRYTSCISAGICHENVKCGVAVCIILSYGF